jgi:hypothetical protein
VVGRDCLDWKLQPKQTVRRRDLGPGYRAVHADSHDVPWWCSSNQTFNVADLEMKRENDREYRCVYTRKTTHQGRDSAVGSRFFVSWPPVDMSQQSVSILHNRAKAECISRSSPYMGTGVGTKENDSFGRRKNEEQLVSDRCRAVNLEATRYHSQNIPLNTLEPSS